MISDCLVEGKTYSPKLVIYTLAKKIAYPAANLFENIDIIILYKLYIYICVYIIPPWQSLFNFAIQRQWLESNMPLEDSDKTSRAWRTTPPPHEALQRVMFIQPETLQSLGRLAGVWRPSPPLQLLGPHGTSQLILGVGVTERKLYKGNHYYLVNGIELVKKHATNECKKKYVRGQSIPLVSSNVILCLKMSKVRSMALSSEQII